MKKILTLFQKPAALSLLNLVLLTSAFAGNVFMQAFCNPVPWAIGALSVAALSLILYPLFVERRMMATLFAFLNGFTFCIFIYCIIFLSAVNFLGLIMILVGTGLLVLIPHVLVIQLFMKQLSHAKYKSIRWAFLSGILISLIIAASMGFSYKAALAEISRGQETDFENFQSTYMTERIVGKHFIYHTRICEFDGWRPPKHDPALVIGMWFNGFDDPLPTDLPKRLSLYKRLFPNRTYKYECSCAIEGSPDYHSDKLWR
ncbi:MAG: hypothetical protein AB8F95_11875 [Bacteroidia bacterium]